VVVFNSSEPIPDDEDSIRTQRAAVAAITQAV